MESVGFQGQTSTCQHHLLQWAEGIDDLEFKLKTVKNKDSEYGHIQDTFINNMIFRPGELEHLGLYDMISQYELNKMPKKKIRIW